MEIAQSTLLCDGCVFRDNSAHFGGAFGHGDGSGQYVRSVFARSSAKQGGTGHVQVGTVGEFSSSAFGSEW